MPITFKIDNKAGIVYTTIDGDVGTDEILDGLKGILTHPDFRPGLNGIADLRNSNLHSFSADVKRIANLLIEYAGKIGPSKTAILVSTNVTFGMTRMFQTFAEKSSIQTEIFQDLKDALQWLGADQEARTTSSKE